MSRGPLLPSRSGGSYGSPLLTPFFALYRDMNRLFDDASGGALTAPLAEGRHGTPLMPKMDVSETDQEIRITAELPGANENDIEVMINDNMLVIRAQKQMEREEDRENYHISERAFGTFMRTLQLPFPVEPDKVQARFENGVLNVTVPKEQTQQGSRRVQVQGMSSQGSQSASDPQGSSASRGQNADSSSGTQTH
jgi:HSP20 family protein